MKIFTHGRENIRLDGVFYKFWAVKAVTRFKAETE